MRTNLSILILGLCALPGPSLDAAEVTVKVIEKKPPAQLSPEIQSGLQPKVVQLLNGDTPELEFWLWADIPASAEPSSPGKALEVLKQPGLIGAIHILKDRRDYRDDELFAGVYTMRFGLQPQDGNHLGTSDFTYFAVLIPAKHDTKPEGIATYKSLTKASSRDTSTEHPLILSLRPVEDKDAAGTLPRITEPVAEHKSVRIELPAKAGSKSLPIPVDLVFEGKSKT